MAVSFTVLSLVLMERTCWLTYCLSGDYFEELQTLDGIERQEQNDSRTACKESSHRWCTHSVTRKGSRYKGLVKVDRVTWTP